MLNHNQLNARLVAAGQMLRLLSHLREQTGQHMGDDQSLHKLAATHPLKGIALIRRKIGELWRPLDHSERNAMDDEIARILDSVTPEPDNPGGVPLVSQGALEVAYYRYRT